MIPSQPSQPLQQPGQTQLTSPLPSSSSMSSHSVITTPSVIVGSIIGSLIFGFLLAVICFLLYKWNKNKQNRDNVIPTPGKEEESNNHEILNLVKPARRNYNQGQEKFSPNLLSINEQEILKKHEDANEVNHEPIYNHGQEAVNNEKATLQNIDDDVLQQLIQTLSQESRLRQETLQNNVQETITSKIVDH